MVKNSPSSDKVSLPSLSPSAWAKALVILTFSAERWKLQQSIARYTSFLNYPSGVEPGHPGLQARQVTSPRAIGQRQMVPAVNCKENAPVSQARLVPLSLLIRKSQTAQHQG